MSDRLKYYKLYINCDDNGEVICFECGRMMANVDSYKFHLDTQHQQDKIHVHLCKFCPKKFADTIQATIHHLEQHFEDENKIKEEPKFKDATQQTDSPANMETKQNEDNK